MKKLTALVIMAFILVAFSSYALAWSPRLQGEPEQFRPGDSRGVFIWHDRDGLHLRTTTKGKEHVFSGVIRTDGHFRDVHGVRTEGGDCIRLDRDRNSMTFRFQTAGGIDGVDFRVKGGDRVYFDLYMDGRKIDTRRIYIGRNGWHPQDNTFVLQR